MFGTALSCLALLILFAASPAGAQCADYTSSLRCISDVEVGAYGTGYNPAGYDDLVVKGRFAYAFQSREGLRIVDLADPANPVNRGILDMSIIERAQIAVIDHYAIVPLYPTLWFIDVDDADAPVRDNILYVPGETSDMTLIGGRVLLVASGDAGLTIISVDDPQTPQILGSLDLGSPARRVACDGEIAVALTADARLHVLDVTFPQQPAPIGSASAGGMLEPAGLAIEGDLVVVGKVDETTVLDISDPTAPLLVGTIQTAGYNAAIIDGVAYLSSQGYEVAAGLYLWDIAGARFAEPIAWLPLDTATRGHAPLAGTGLVVAVTQGGHSINDAPLGLLVVDPGAARLPGSTGVVHNNHAESRYEAVFIDGMCYVAKTDDLGVFDVHDVAAPIHVQDIPGGIECIDTWNGMLFTARELWGNNRFESWSLADPYAPTELDLLVGENYRPGDLRVFQGNMYVTRHDGGINVVDVSEPTSMSVRHERIFAAYQTSEIRVLDGELWIGSEQGLLRVDVSDPDQPSIVTQYPASGELRRIQWYDGRRLAALIVRSDGGRDAWEIWDVTDPDAAIRLVHREQPCHFQPQIFDVLLHDGVIYAAGPLLTDLYAWNGTNDPERIAMIPDGDGESPTGSTITLELYADQLAVIGGEDVEMRFRPLQCSGPTSVVAARAPSGPSLRAAPNPFNPAVTVTFTLAQAQTMRLDVHDLAGRRVARLVDGPFPEGAHRATWRGRDDRGRVLPTGTYFLRLATERGIVTKKVLLMR